MKKLLLISLLFLELTAFDAFVTPSELANSMDNPNLIILDVSKKETYKKSHIKHSIHVDLAPYFFEDIEKSFRKLGINNDSSVLIYSHNTEHSILKSSYLAYLLIKSGFENVSILDGGFMAWVFEYMLHTTSKPFYPKQNGNFTLQKTDLTLSKNFIQKNLFNLNILDARTTQEYYGIQKSKGIQNLGHIPTAKSSYYKNKFFKDSTLREKSEMEQIYIKGYDLNKSKTVLVYANTLFESSMEWYIIYKYLNIKNTKIYEGSFFEWGNDTNLSTTRFKWE